jgi:hypothetical protein
MELKFKKLMKMDKCDLVRGIFVRLEVCNKTAQVGIIKSNMIT